MVCWTSTCPRSAAATPLVTLTDFEARWEAIPNFEWYRVWVYESHLLTFRLYPDHVIRLYEHAATVAECEARVVARMLCEDRHPRAMLCRVDNGLWAEGRDRTSSASTTGGATRRPRGDCGALAPPAPRTTPFAPTGAFWTALRVGQKATAAHGPAPAPRTAPWRRLSPHSQPSRSPPPAGRLWSRCCGCEWRAVSAAPSPAGCHCPAGPSCTVCL